MTNRLIAGLVLIAGSLVAQPRFSGGVVFGGGPAYYGPAYGPEYYGPAYYEAVRPPFPGPGYYWVDGYWFADRGYRHWRPGYWAAPRYYNRYRGQNFRGRDRDWRDDHRDDRRRR